MYFIKIITNNYNKKVFLNEKAIIKNDNFSIFFF
jgi:hypothetical protein